MGVTYRFSQTFQLSIILGLSGILLKCVESLRLGKIRNASKFTSAILNNIFQCLQGFRRFFINNLTLANHDPAIMFSYNPSIFTLNILLAKCSSRTGSRVGPPVRVPISRNVAGYSVQFIISAEVCGTDSQTLP